jgi:outer membrane protein
MVLASPEQTNSLAPVTLLNFAARRPVSCRPFGTALLPALLLLAGMLGARTPTPEGTRLSLDEAVTQALENNLGLRIERLEPVISAAGVASADAAFDTTLFATGRLAESDADNAGTPITTPSGEVITAPTKSDNRSYSAGARKRLRVTNATVQIQTALQRSAGSSFNTDLGQFVGGSLRETSDLSISLTQPLLRGFGREIAEAPLERARAAERATRSQLRDAILDLVENTESAYWNLASAESRLEVRRTNLRLAESLLEEMRERERLGLATRLDLIQASANLAQREDDLTVAEQNVREAADTLLLLLGGLNSPTGLFLEDVSVQALPAPTGGLPEVVEVWNDANRASNAIAIQEEILRQREIETRLARDEHRPQLDLTVGGSIDGRSDESATEAFRLTREADGTAWNLQVGFSIPWGRHAAVAGIRSANARLAQAQWRLQQLKQQLLQEVRRAHRELETRQKRLRSAELVLRLQEETYTQERTKLDEGLSTVRDVLEVQTDLDNARLSLLDAKTAVIQAELGLERLRGTLLDRHGLTWPGVAPEALP